MTESSIPRPSARARRRGGTGSLVFACALALAVAAAACSHGQDATTAVTTSTLAPLATDHLGAPPAPDDPVLTNRIDAAAAFLEAHLAEADAPSMIIVGNLAKRHSLDNLISWVDKGSAALEAEVAKEQAGQFVPWSTAFARMADPARTGSPEFMAQLPFAPFPNDVAWLSSTSFYCDTPNLPAGWVDIANQLIDTDNTGYVSTHVLFALAVMAERGCLLPGLEDLRARAIGVVSDALRANPEVTDLNLERMALLGELGRSDLVERQWITRTLEAQQADGGWLMKSGDTSSDWHPTFLALWLLSAYRNPTATGPLFHT